VTTSKRNRTRVLVAGIVVVVLAVVGVLVARGGGDDRDRPPGDRLGALDAEAPDVLERWGAAIDELARGDRLGELHWEADERLALEHAQQALDTWGVLDLYRAPGGRLKAVDLVGAYTTDDERVRFRADALAALAAVDDLDLDEGAQLLDERLGLDEPSGPTSQEVDHGGVHLVLERSATQAELRITAR
jgi:hypothetical protein